MNIIIKTTLSLAFFLPFFSCESKSKEKLFYGNVKSKKWYSSETQNVYEFFQDKTYKSYSLSSDGKLKNNAPRDVLGIEYKWDFYDDSIFFMIDLGNEFLDGGKMKVIYISNDSMIFKPTIPEFYGDSVVYIPYDSQ
ncbi:MAG: hypothetical protein ACWA41_06610 [Putridiphycobacter sp.]